jgi:hypothetical protein
MEMGRGQYFTFVRFLAAGGSGLKKEPAVNYSIYNRLALCTSSANFVVPPIQTNTEIGQRDKSRKPIVDAVKYRLRTGRLWLWLLFSFHGAIHIFSLYLHFRIFAQVCGQLRWTVNNE